MILYVQYFLIKTTSLSLHWQANDWLMSSFFLPAWNSTSFIFKWKSFYTEIFHKGDYHNFALEIGYCFILFYCINNRCMSVKKTNDHVFLWCRFFFYFIINSIPWILAYFWPCLVDSVKICKISEGISEMKGV